MSNPTPPAAATAETRREASSERAVTETISRLQRGILRLALAYHGKNAELDRKLKEFGTLIRHGRRQADRQTLIDEIVNTIVSLDLNPTQAACPPATATAARAELHQFLELVAVPERLRPEIERTQRLLAQAKERSAILAQIKQLADLFSQNLVHATDRDAEPAMARALLIEMIEHMPLAPAMLSELSQLRRTIESADAPETFAACVANIAKLVGDMRSELHNELEHMGGFLRDTEARLREFEDCVQHSRDLHSAATSDTLQLSDTINDELHTLRNDAEAAPDLGAVQSLISKRLDNITSGLNTFVTAQELRALKANDSIDHMKQRLHELEAQSEHLRADLEQQHARVLIDPLTGVMNRAGYIETAAKQVSRWRRHGGALSLAVLDLDLFKHINDEYGHTAGDRVLSTVARKLSEIIRESDMLSRFGGEEFVLLLPETSAQQAFVLIEKLREHIEHCPFRHKDTPVKVTVSCGVAEFRDGDALDAVFDRADAAMYRAKKAGRNRVCLEFPDEPGDARGKFRLSNGYEPALMIAAQS
ncbi:MAG: GGDEF domain-containing protein [Gammaproteobacteria bacterium]